MLAEANNNPSAQRRRHPTWATAGVVPWLALLLVVPSLGVPVGKWHHHGYHDCHSCHDDTSDDHDRQKDTSDDHDCTLCITATGIVVDLPVLDLASGLASCPVLVPDTPQTLVCTPLERPVARGPPLHTS